MPEPGVKMRKITVKIEFVVCVCLAGDKGVYPLFIEKLYPFGTVPVPATCAGTCDLCHSLTTGNGGENKWMDVSDDDDGAEAAVSKKAVAESGREGGDGGDVVMEDAEVLTKEVAGGEAQGERPKLTKEEKKAKKKAKKAKKKAEKAIEGEVQDERPELTEEQKREKKLRKEEKRERKRLKEEARKNVPVEEEAGGVEGAEVREGEEAKNKTGGGATHEEEVVRDAEEKEREEAERLERRRRKKAERRQKEKERLIERERLAQEKKEKEEREREAKEKEREAKEKEREKKEKEREAKEREAKEKKAKEREEKEKEAKAKEAKAKEAKVKEAKAKEAKAKEEKAKEEKAKRAKEEKGERRKAISMGKKKATSSDDDDSSSLDSEVADIEYKREEGEDDEDDDEGEGDDELDDDDDNDGVSANKHKSGKKKTTTTKTKDEYKGHMDINNIGWKGSLTEQQEAIRLYKKYLRVHALLLPPLDYDNISEEDLEAYTAAGSLAIQIFAHAKKPTESVPLPPKFRQALRDVQGLLPASASTSRTLTLHILVTNKKNIWCMYHWPRAKRKNVVRKKPVGFKVTGFAAPSDPGQLSCGCATDTACMEFIIYKTWIAVDKDGNRERVALFEPRAREFIIQNLFAWSRFKLDDLFNDSGLGWDDLQLLKIRRVQRDNHQQVIWDVKDRLHQKQVSFEDSDVEEGEYCLDSERNHLTFAIIIQTTLVKDDSEHGDPSHHVTNRA
ncbi:hypothetical protein BDN72DRAFT_861864 [Pluteus cervinus]|uniref:Uncharacterized protein n=1 Tax=Pluteus cervinus TaxID=181527 RepID=A0ACD3ADP4_9AGAR|nr:hypothetical protein BDN72DRAFT_861864 [Pluteus cervinus]